MAKSLRSKWKRKMRAVKRERYGEKENDRLIKMLTAAGEFPQNEVKMEEPKPEKIEFVPREREIKRVDRRIGRGEGRTTRRSRRDDKDDLEDEEAESSLIDGEEELPESMLVDKPEHVFSRRTMRDQFGNYPAWMNKRKMVTQQKKNKRISRRRAMSVMGKSRTAMGKKRRQQ